MPCAFEKVRNRIEQVQQFAGLFARLDQRRQHLQRGNCAIAGGRMVEQDHMARLFAANIISAGLHRLQHIAVTHLGAHQTNVFGCQKALKAKVGHDRGHHAAALQQALFRHG